MKKILVIGSGNVDYTAYVDSFPEVGETINGNGFLKAVGGKGVNQACTIGRLGGPVTMVCSLGNDNDATLIESSLKADNVNAIIKRSCLNTGMAMIAVDSASKNEIIVIKGSNFDLLPEDIEGLESTISASDIIVLQLEIPLITVEKVLYIAGKHHKTTILNPAPVSLMKKEIFPLIGFITPNEVELSKLTGHMVNDMEQTKKAMSILLSLGVKNVITTLGDKGAMLMNKDLTVFSPAHKVKAIDTVAAGDCFNGAFAFALANDMPLNECMDFGNAASSIAVTRKGAIPSLPSLEEVRVVYKRQ